MQPVLPIVQLRDATSDDAPFIARVVLAGIDMLEIDTAIPDEQRAIYEHLIDICLMGDTLYSYLNTRIAEIEGYRVGALVAYDGARYAALRAKTFGLVQQTSGMDLSRNAMETGSGEFYLDSMAILSDYRGIGIGKMLIRDRMDFALGNGFQKVTLLVDKDKSRLQGYYESLGFVFSEEMYVFGAWYNKLEKNREK
ncbi:MAG: GNAT family N-acetyltransferase [Bacteroidales bacterium]|nr:GNAT family N-acetyltransferase [Bacteroidales bacterium]MBR0540034.1 GNAT family N-acetyltransferase [Bacteroidales bacterium]